MGNFTCEISQSIEGDRAFLADLDRPLKIGFAGSGAVEHGYNPAGQSLSP
ncbi:MAG: hypothetical protein RMY62_008460 [Nostoc sp. ZfuVER08]|nr:hypothetical protein [Nostoc sp. ZfuVER08]